ncbi:arylamine N-acetyltransferase [Actinoplanes sp. N902-109]|uniref:arylamine N-acetyltransferase family protein n=1 Tax=Actinoplanes sp. (strain N902-109) TaxID=649831 RepID=UPI0003296006|nr:arylamine N-acetyltransferase [Actinoplanes sp. N902-109]AGL16409.1 N-acetyltransferase [Actinoplanes sp. N902-109]
MFTVDKYLQHLGYEEPPPPTLATLRELHLRHLSRVQYDTRYAGRLNPVNMADMDLDETFDNVVLAAEGGMCLQLNTLFDRLLTGLGFRSTVVGGGTWIPGNVFCPDPEHMLMVVDVEDGSWLADVGHAGISFTEPLRFAPGVQQQNGCEFRLLEQDGYHVVQTRTKGRDWRMTFRFTTQARVAEDWTGVGDGGGPALMASVRRRRRAVPGGQVTMTRNLFTLVEDGVEHTRLLRDPAEERDVIDTYWEGRA